MVIVNFIRDKEVGMFARVKRKDKGAPVTWTPPVTVEKLK